MEIVSNLALVAIILVGSRLIGENELSYGDFYYFWIFLGRFFQPIRDMAEQQERAARAQTTPLVLPVLSKRRLRSNLV